MILLSEDKVREIRILFNNGMGCREIGRQLNIHHTKISSITRGKSYCGVGLLNNGGKDGISTHDKSTLAT